MAVHKSFDSTQFGFGCSALRWKIRCAACVSALLCTATMSILYVKVKKEEGGERGTSAFSVLRVLFKATHLCVYSLL
jgi:hypothetical protein